MIENEQEEQTETVNVVEQTDEEDSESERESEMSEEETFRSINRIIKNEVLLTVGCPICLPFYIDSQISVHRKLKKIDQLIFRNAKEIYFDAKFPILYLFTLCKIEISLK